MRMRTIPTATTRNGASTRWPGSWMGKVELDYRPVHLNPLIGHNEGGIDLDKIKPKARVY
jgi:hypothetical protein